MLGVILSLFYVVFSQKSVSGTEKERLYSAGESVDCPVNGAERLLVTFVVLVVLGNVRQVFWVKIERFSLTRRFLITVKENLEFVGFKIKLLDRKSVV